MIQKTFSAETKVLDPAKGLVETMFAVTANVDRQNDRIIPGAFAKALAAKTSVPVCYAHKWDDLAAVLGKTVEWTELRPGDTRLPASLLQKGYGGVRAMVQFELGVPAGQIAFTHVRNKNITNWSWAFDIDDEGAKFADEGNVREIKSVKEIFEVTLALVGANQEAMTMAIQKTMEMQRESKASDDEEWSRINAYIAEQVAREDAVIPKAQPSKSPGVLSVPAWRQSMDASVYVAGLHAEKAAADKAQQDYYEELRRKMGLPAGYGR